MYFMIIKNLKILKKLKKNHIHLQKFILKLIMSQKELIDLIKNKNDSYPLYYELETVLTDKEVKIADNMFNDLLVKHIDQLDVKTLKFLLYNIIKTTPHIEDNKHLVELGLVNNNDHDVVFYKLLNKFSEKELQEKIQEYKQHLEYCQNDYQIDNQDNETD